MPSNDILERAQATAPGDFAFQTGRWSVRHRQLRRRLVGDDMWRTFDGVCSAWELIGGAANADDQYLDHPDGAYRAATVRRRDPVTGLWSIWWWDERHAAIEPPVLGRFENAVGTFLADDQLDGRPVKVRFLWSKITPDSAQWEQAFSPDAGASWETNWIMNFQRQP